MDAKLKSLLWIIVFSFTLFSLKGNATADLDQAVISVGVNIGAGNVITSVNNIDNSDSALYLGFTVHYRNNQRYLVGLELSGWTLESGNLSDPSKGEAINQLFVVAQYYPIIDLDLFLKAGGGYTSYWNNQPGTAGRMRGTGFTFGGGYDYHIQNHWALVPFLLFGIAETAGDDHHGWALGVGIAKQF